MSTRSHPRWQDPPQSLLVLCWCALLAIRLLIFNDAGTIGAYVVVIAFWLVSAALAIRSVLAIRKGDDSWENPMILIGLLAFVFPQITGQGTAAQVSFAVFLVAVFGLAILYVKRAASRRRDATDNRAG